MTFQVLIYALIVGVFSCSEKTIQERISEKADSNKAEGEASSKNREGNEGSRASGDIDNDQAKNRDALDESLDDDFEDDETPVQITLISAAVDRENISEFQSLNCSYKSDPIDADAITVAWLVNDDEIEASGETLKPKWFRRGDSVACIIKYGDESLKSKNSAQIGEAVPIANIPNISNDGSFDVYYNNAIAQDGYLYQTYTESESKLKIYKIGAGMAPQFVKSLALPRYSSRLEFAGKFLYIFGGAPEGQLLVYDISDKENPKFIRTIAMPSPNSPLWAMSYDKGRLALATRLNTHLFDASDPSSPILKSSIPSEPGAFALGTYTLSAKFSGKWLTTAGYNYGSKTYDISDLANPEIAINLNFDKVETDLIQNGTNVRGWSWGWSAVIVGKFSYTGGEYSGLGVYDISDFSNPKKIKNYRDADPQSFKGSVFKLKYIEPYLFAAGSDSTTVYDLADPKNPVEAFSFPKVYVSMDCHVTDDYIIISGDSIYVYER